MHKVKQSEDEIKKTIPFAVTSGGINFLGIKLTKKTTHTCTLGTTKH